jgi:DNA gyrase subunit A
MITEEEMVITVSHNGYIKRVALSTYRSQRRGGKGLKGMETREEDFVEQLFIGSTHDYMLFFTNRGRLYWLKIYQIPEAGRSAKGKAIVNLLNLAEGEQMTTALPVKDFSTGYLVQYTKRGIVKKTPLKDYSNPRSTGIIALTLRDGDELIAVSMTDGTSDLMMGTSNGLAIRFNEEDVRGMGRTASGVIGIRLREGDEVVSAGVAYDRTSLLTVTENGLGKRTRIEDYPVRGRGGKGVISIKVTEKGGKAVGLMRVTDDDEIVMMSNRGKLIRTRAGNISLMGRNTQGVKLMDVNHEDRVVSMGRVAEKD